MAAALRVFSALAIIAVSTALPADHELLKVDPGPRYQYMSSPEGVELVDLAWKPSDLLETARFDAETQVFFHLFTRANPTVSQPLLLGVQDILDASNFDASKKTVVIVHGWRNTPLHDFNVYLVHAYLQAEDVNMIMVDWSIGAGALYVVAMANNIRTGEQVAKFVTWLNSATGASLDNYHMIGHSLGGHQVGIIGRNLGGEVAYITALDPAMPGWIVNPSGFKPTDGKYTEAIHTDLGFAGRVRPVADVDFYPNQGFNMPGCETKHCSHHKCIFYMAESLMNGGFTGQRCDSLWQALTRNCASSDTLPMGGTTAKPGATGIYYLTTNPLPPYSQG
ncbi:pancreatic lipase-related protein 2 [Spodoptera frugiperda]|uniref:Pancreatic lipase-related protein 2 n=1 Tax=Spodoptera frugiperda TaxID=7108 RepID=A0A9R0DZK3_SPOFR|nr:pancreatic lipase-related protein 2 [Spodoptera frugiperda]